MPITMITGRSAGLQRTIAFINQPAGRIARSLGLVATLLAGCGSAAMPGDVASGDAVSTDTAPGPDVVTTEDAGVDVQPDVQPDVPADVPFETAMHNPLPRVANRGGPTMHNVKLVVITYADDTNRAGIEEFGAWVGGSNWLTTVGHDYGVGAGTLLANAELTTNAPDAITSTEIETMITTGITNHTLPVPADGDFSNVLYMVFFPQHTAVSLVQQGGPAAQSCQDFGGFHDEARSGTLHVSYAAVPDCGPVGPTRRDIDGETLAASHEYIEAATDAFPLSRPAYQLRLDGTSAWAFIGGEVGDLCELGHGNYTESGHLVQRIWSNSAAAMGADPCIPSDPTRTYFNVSFDPGDVAAVNPGDTLTLTLTGWSVAPVPDWTLNIQPQGGNLNLRPVLSSPTINNGRTSTITIAIPASAPSQSYETFLITSIGTTRTLQTWPFVVYVQ